MEHLETLYFLGKCWLKQETNLGTALAAFCNYVCHKVSIILALETYFFWRTVDRGKGRAHGKKWRVINETPRLILVEESFPSFCRRKKRKKSPDSDGKIRERMVVCDARSVWRQITVREKTLLIV